MQEKAVGSTAIAAILSLRQTKPVQLVEQPNARQLCINRDFDALRWEARWNKWYVLNLFALTDMT